MKKAICIIVVIISTLIAGCGQSGDKVSSENEFENQVDSQIEEPTQIIELPEKYKSYTSLTGIDEEYYYFTNNDNSKQWKYLKIKKDDVNTLKVFPGIDNKLDTSLTFARKGKLYVTTLDWGKGGHRCNYQVLELTDDGRRKTLLSGQNEGLPSMTNCGDNLVMQSNRSGKCELKIFNMETKQQKTIFSSNYKESNDGKITGTVVTGLEWPRTAPSDEGFCFTESEMKGQTINDAKEGNHIAYYYSLKDNKLEALTNVDHPSDYVGGSQNVFAVADYSNEINVIEMNKIYYLDNGGYKKYAFKGEEDSIPFMGASVLDKNRFLAYTTDGYYLFDLSKKTYDKKRYSIGADTMDAKELKQLDYKDCVTGMEIYDQTFYFSTVKQGKISLYAIK